MNETLRNIASRVKTSLDQGSLGQFTVSARTTDGNSGFVSRTGDSEPEKYNLTLLIQNEAAESNPVPYKNHIINTLEKLTPLAPYIDFKQPEPEKDHLTHLAEKLDGLRAKAASAGLIIPEDYSNSIRERAKLQALQETTSEYVRTQEGRAIEVSRNDNFITASFMVPSSVNADEVQKAFESRLDFKTLLGRMTAKKLTQDPTQQAAIIEKIKACDVVVTTQSFGDGYNNVNIEIRSPEVTAAMKEPGGLMALSPEKQKALKESNPLMQLKDGDGLTPENPADLRKAIARTILFEGEKGEKPIALFSKIAGPLDVKTAIEKSFKYIKALKPELAADVDTIVKDPLFEDHSNWRATKTADGKPKKQMISIGKRNDLNYVEGQFGVDLSIPADKLPEVLNQLAALGNGQAVTPPANPVADTAVPPVEAPDNTAIAAAIAASATAPDGTNVNGAGAFAGNIPSGLLANLATAGPTSLKDRAAAKDSSLGIAG